MLSKKDIESKILDLNNKMDRIRSQCNNPSQSPQFMYLRGIKDGIYIALGRMVL